MPSAVGLVSQAVKQPGHAPFGCMISSRWWRCFTLGAYSLILSSARASCWRDGFAITSYSTSGVGAACVAVCGAGGARVGKVGFAVERAAGGNATTPVLATRTAPVGGAVRVMPSGLTGVVALTDIRGTP